jgi:AcrR family transcriptional regulator
LASGAAARDTASPIAHPSILFFSCFQFSVFCKHALALLRSTLEEALASDERPALAAIAQQLGCSRSTLRRYFPELCRALAKRYRERNIYGQVRQRLEEVLASNEEAPSVKELARLMGCKYQNIRNHFPELCKQITARHSAVLRRRHEERVANHCSRIRQAVVELHQQGIYPSRQRVGQLLKDMAVIHLLRSTEGHEAWWERALRFLNRCYDRPHA